MLLKEFGMRRFKIVVLLIVTVAILCACEDKPNNTSVPISEGISATPTETVAPTITPRQTPTPIVFENPALQELAGKDPHSWYQEGFQLAAESEERYSKWLRIFDTREFYGGYSEYTRKIAEILEMIPEDWPRLTAADARRVIQELKDEGFFVSNQSFDVYQVRNRFNEIAFAPDFDAVRGIAAIRYFTSNARTEYVEITDGRIVLWERGENAPKEILYDWVAEHPGMAVVLAPTITPTITPRNTPTPMVYDNPLLTELVSNGTFDLYARSMNIATEEQKEKLRAIHDNREFPTWDEAFERKVAVIMGLIPEDWPRLTVEDAKRILREMEDEELFLEKSAFNVNIVRKRFDEIAFAPDCNDGSGFSYIRYFIDDTKTDFIEINDWGVIVRDITSSTPKETLYDAVNKLMK